MKAGDIVLTVMPISSQLQQYNEGFDLLLEKNHSAYNNTGLVTASIFRLASLAVLESGDITGTIGYLDADLHYQLLKNLAVFLLK